jgi:hypothetical protein
MTEQDPGVYTDNEYIDENGNRYYLDENGEPDFDDPVITLSEWIAVLGIHKSEAENLEKIFMSYKSK